MVQGRENLTTIAGAVVGRSPHPRLPDWDVVRLAVDETEPVPGQADVLSSRTGTTMDVAVRRELLAGAGAGARLRCRAKMTVDGPICEPWPAPADFAITPAG